MAHELLRKLELHRSLKEASPGFHLSDGDIDEIIDLLRGNIAPLFVSYVCNLGGKHTQGWAVMDHRRLDDATAIEHLTRKVEQARGYDAGTLVLIGFQRLEAALPRS